MPSRTLSATSTTSVSHPPTMSKHPPFTGGHVSQQISQAPLQPPVPFSEFQFSLDPSLQPLLFQEAAPAPPSSTELLSASETTNLFGFLDNFDWDFDASGLFAGQDSTSHSNGAGYTGKPAHNVNSRSTTSATNTNTQIYKPLASPEAIDAQFTHFLPPSKSKSKHPHAMHPYARPKSPSSPNSAYPCTSNPAQAYAHSRSDSSSSTSQSSTPINPTPSSTPSNPAAPRNKPLLTDPQKRMNHIMSEQKRRNAIREGYAQLTTLLAPAGAPPGTGMPTRGRPKGSGAKGKGKPTAGKSGVLLRAVEYCKWLEEGRDALLEEVLRIEAAAGIRVDS